MFGLFLMLLSITTLIIGNFYLQVISASLYNSLLLSGNIWLFSLILYGVLTGILQKNVKHALKKNSELKPIE